MALAREDLAAALLRGAVKLHEGYTPAGERLDWSMDCREVLLSGEPLLLAARALWEAVRGYSPAAVGGVTLSADPLVIALLLAALEDGVPMKAFLIRKKPKEYGMRKLIEGPPLDPGTRVVVVDDLVGAGDTAEWAVDVLGRQGIAVSAVGTLIDFQRGARQRLEHRGVDLVALCTLQDLGFLPRWSSRPLETSRRWRWAPLNARLDARLAEARHSAPAWNADGTVMYAGSDQGYLAAFSAATGTRAWHNTLGGTRAGVSAAPLVLPGRVICGALDGAVYCLAADTGRLLWQAGLGDYVVAAACADAAAGRVFAGTGRTDGTGGVHALDLADGRLLWHLPTSDPVESGPWHETAADLVVCGSTGGVLAAVTGAGGHPVWQARLDGPLRGRVTGDGQGSVFAVSDGGALHAVDAESGSIRWRRALARTAAASPLCVAGLVIAGSGDHLVAFDRADGEIRWAAAVGGRVTEPACLAGHGAIAAGSTDGGVYLIETATGDIRARYETGGPVLARPAAHGDLVCVVSGDRCLHLLAVAAAAGRTEGEACP